MLRKSQSNATIGAVNAGTAQRNQPSIGDSYNKMFGQDYASKFTGILPSTNNGFYNSMSGLEGASMRLANAASKRSMDEARFGSELKRKETESDYGIEELQSAKNQGYYSPQAMYDEIKEKREMTDRGYIKSAGRWIKKQ